MAHYFQVGKSYQANYNNYCKVPSYVPSYTVIGQGAVLVTITKRTNSFIWFDMKLKNGQIISVKKKITVPVKNPDSEDDYEYVSFQVKGLKEMWIESLYVLSDSMIEHFYGD